MVIKFLSAAGKGCNISLVVIGVRVGSLAVVPGFHLGGGGCRTGVHVGDGGVDHGGAAVFGGQARHAAEAVVGVVGGYAALRRLGQPVVLVIGIGAACCPDVADKRRPRPLLAWTRTYVTSRFPEPLNGLSSPLPSAA